VNKAQNAVEMRHIPTGIVVKVHESRLLSKNIQLAFERIKFAVDQHLNGDQCYAEQLKRLERERQQRNVHQRERMRRIRADAIEQGDKVEEIDANRDR